MRSALAALVLASLAVIVAYVWFVSVGYWTWWPKTTYTYDLLGSAFRSGQLSLQAAPDPALLSLPNPYDPSARAGIQYPWDASLYNGKYYLYWGPTPGVVLAVIKLFYGRQIADQFLVFVFVLGTYVFGACLLVALWHRYFSRSVPAGVLALSFLGLGLVGPSTWLLNRPAGYEAAIAGGQFFLMGGILAGIRASMKEPASRTGLALAGIAWAFALGSRISTVFPIAVMSVVILLKLARDAGGVRKALGSTAALLVPLLLGAAALAWYNWARFGSPTEFGLRYQLTVIDLHALYPATFSLSYVPDNLYNYLANPFGLSRLFPFLVPLMPGRLPAGPALHIPTAQLEAVTGVLINAPFLAYSVMPLFASMLGRQAASGTPPEGPKASMAQSPVWLYLALTGSALVAFGLVLLYFYPTMRQLEDVVPVLALLAILGLWEGWRALQNRRLEQVGFGGVSLVLILFSIAACSLLAVTSYDNRFLHLNRDLLRELIKFFGR